MNTFSTVFDKTVEMLKDRHYVLPKSFKTINNPFCEPYNGILYVKKPYKNNKYKKVMLHFSLEKFGIQDLRKKIQQLIVLQIDHIIFIIDNKFTSQSLRELQQYQSLQHEIFYFSEMMFNPTKHIFVPKHEILTDAEAKQMIETCGRKLPAIKVSDRICRYYNGKPGQIFRIYRPNELYYRQVVK